MRQFFLTITMLTMSLMAMSQIDTTIFLISKVDFQPQYELHDGKLVGLMGYSKTLGGALVLPSPTLEVEEGDSVNLSFWNLSQGAPHSIHLHGLDVNQENDGVPMLSFDVVHDDTGSYYFEAPHPGTYIYHCHVTSVLHVQGGMYGLFIVRPKNNPNQTWDNGYDFHSEKAWMLSELDTNWHHDSIINHDHDPTATTHIILPYEPQHFLVNGKSESQLDSQPYEAAVGEKVYMRLANIGYYGNRIIFPSALQAFVVSSDGRPLPNAYASDTLDMYPGERYGVLLEANSEFTDQISIDYIDLNTQEVENTQNVAVTIEGFVGQEELKQENNIFPNPASDLVHVSENGTWELVTVMGQTVLHTDVMNKKIDLRGVPNGTYLLRGPKNTIKKLLILKP